MYILAVILPNYLYTTFNAEVKEKAGKFPRVNLEISPVSFSNLHIIKDKSTEKWE